MGSNPWTLAQGNKAHFPACTRGISIALSGKQRLYEKCAIFCMITRLS